MQAKESTADSTTVAAAEPSAAAPHQYATKASYSSSFEIGDPKQGDIVIELWKQFDANTLDQGLNYFADTVDLWTNDGWRISWSKRQPDGFDEETPRHLLCCKIGRGSYNSTKIDRYE
jgi:hypothetical protein